MQHATCTSLITDDEDDDDNKDITNQATKKRVKPKVRLKTGIQSIKTKIILIAFFRGCK